MKKFASEKAFTLVEMSVVLSVVALIGSMMVGGVVASNKNRVDANVLEFFDKVIEEAHENFKISPKPILENDVSLPEPYQTMSFSSIGAASGEDPGFQYVGFYTEDLIGQNGISTGESKYMLSIRFTQEPGTTEEIDFASTIVSYRMLAQVVELKDGAYDYDNPLLERVFKGIASEMADDTSNSGGGGENTVTYHAITGEVTSATILNYMTGQTAENTMTVVFTTGDDFGSQRVGVKKHEGGDKTFIGWATDPSSREVISSWTKVTADTNVYAVYSDYRVEFQLQKGQQFSPSVVAPNPHDENYFVEKEFEEGEEQTTIREMIQGNGDAERIVTALLGEPNGQVIDDGYEFKGWRDAITKNPISKNLGGPGLDAVLKKDGSYLQLEAVMEEIEVDKTDTLTLELDLSNLIENGRKFYVYGISDLDYKVTFVDKDGQKQLAVQMKETTSWKGDTQSVDRTFTVGDGKLMIKDGNGNTYTNTAEYFEKLMKGQPGKYIVLKDIALRVKAPSFNSGEYRGVAETQRDNVTFNGVKVTDKELQSLDAGSSTNGLMEYKTATADGIEVNFPMDEEKHEELQAWLLNLYGQHKDSWAQLTLQNVGSITHTDTKNSSVTSRRKEVVSTTQPTLGFATREISVRIVIPMSFLQEMHTRWKSFEYKASLGVENNKIYVRFDATANGLFNLYERSSYEKIDTGIPYTETIKYNGKSYTITNRIQTIEIQPDTVESRARFEVEPEVTLQDGMYNSITNGDSLKKIRAVEIEGGTRPRVNEAHPNNWYSLEHGSHIFRIFKPGFYGGVTAEMKTGQTTGEYILQTSYPNSTRMHVGSYTGEDSWDTSLKNSLRESFINGNGNGTAFDDAWQWAQQNGLMITYVMPGKSTTSYVNISTFNFTGSEQNYTSLPLGFVCTEK